MQESHIWFNKAVARWLDIALYKAMQRIIKVNFLPFVNLKILIFDYHIDRLWNFNYLNLNFIFFKLDNKKLFKLLLSYRQAVELDDLSPVDDLVKHSSSAVDIRTVLMQVFQIKPSGLCIFISSSNIFFHIKPSPSCKIYYLQNVFV